MKKFKQLLCLALALTISASLLAACGQKDNGGNKDSDEKVLTYAVEGGSAGEEIALEKGWKVTTLEDQAAALMEVASGTSDAAIIDLLMAGAMIGEGTSYPDLTYTDRLTEEEYGIGCRKGSDLAQYINCVLGDAYQSGTMQKLAQQYGITEELLVPQQESTFTSAISSRRVRWWWASRSSPPWTIRMKMASGSALTQTLPSWWRSVWVWKFSSWSSTGARRSMSWTARPSTWCGTA